MEETVRTQAEHQLEGITTKQVDLRLNCSNFKQDREVQSGVSVREVSNEKTSPSTHQKDAAPVSDTHAMAARARREGEQRSWRLHQRQRARGERPERQGSAEGEESPGTTRVHQTLRLEQTTKSASEPKAGGTAPRSPGAARQGAPSPRGGVSAKPEGTGITGLLSEQLHSVN